MSVASADSAATSRTRGRTEEAARGARNRGWMTPVGVIGAIVGAWIVLAALLDGRHLIPYPWVLVQQFGGTLFTIAKDVKLQVEFNPARVREYRLVGYENRLLASEDFNNDRKDAGELGSGHTVTALYEVVPVGARASVDPLKYQPNPTTPTPNASAELLTVKLRYKQPQGNSSKLLELPLTGSARPLAEASENLRFATAVAQFGMLLRDSEHKARASAESVLLRARGALGGDEGGYRAEFVRLVERWDALGRVAARER